MSECGPHAIDNYNQLWCGGTPVPATHLDEVHGVSCTCVPSDCPVNTPIVEEENRVNVALDILNLEYTIMIVEREYEDDLGVVSFLRSLIRVLVRRMNSE